MIKDVFYSINGDRNISIGKHVGQYELKRDTQGKLILENAAIPGEILNR